ncbi:MAG TPA: sulfite exporter TauE/SafE family protein, partial [Longimicrobium sp.]|nr:sulfite exporter TauE/SafE family protein [Longimicrobium sp.]
MTWGQAVLLVSAATAAGALNAVAGGGTFLTFPSLVFVGVDPIRANATSTVSLWPGGVSSAFAYRRQLTGARRDLPWLLGASVVGGGIGAALLLLTPAATFTRLIPFLLLAATLLFTFNQRLLRLLRGREGGSGPLSLPASAVALLFVSVYGGYFGAGVGILLLALFSLMKFETIHQMNALKALSNAATNAVALLIFVAAGAVDWGKGGLMIGGAIAGGYLGAAVAQKLKSEWVRSFVVATAWG